MQSGDLIFRVYTKDDVWYFRLFGWVQRLLFGGYCTHCGVWANSQGYEAWDNDLKPENDLHTGSMTAGKALVVRLHKVPPESWTDKYFKDLKKKPFTYNYFALFWFAVAKVWRVFFKGSPFHRNDGNICSGLTAEYLKEVAEIYPWKYVSSMVAPQEIFDHIIYNRLGSIVDER